MRIFRQNEWGNFQQIGEISHVHAPIDVATACPTRLRTNLPNNLMKGAESFNPGIIRYSRMPKAVACARCSMSISCNVSTWSETNEMGTTSACLRPCSASRLIVACIDGCSHLDAPTLL